MQAYRCDVEFQDYLFFATTERGKTFETGPFIHNYALTYALIMAGVTDFQNPDARPSYYYEKQIPQYQKELQPFNRVGFYVTPAYPLSIRFRQTQFNTQKEGYEFRGKDRSIAYPDWGFLRTISPQSTFRFYILLGTDDFPLKRQRHIRLGKFLSKANVSWEKAGDVSCQKTQRSEFRGILNWQDLTQKPRVFNIISGALPSKLIQNCYFEHSEGYEFRFGEKDRVFLPRGMSYMAELDKIPPKKKRSSENRLKK